MNPSAPSWLIRAWHRLVFSSRRAQLSRELTEEIEFHRLLRQAENSRAGLTPEAARDLSRRQMGNIAIATEDCRDMWSFVRLERLLQDIRFAARMFARTPGFTAIAVLSLAVGIGGNAAMLSLVDTLLVRPLPYLQPDRLIRVTGIYPRAAVPVFQQRGRTMDIAAVGAPSEYNLTGRGTAIRVFGATASSNLFSVLGTPVARGRGFELGEDLPGRDALVIIGDSLWRRKFAADPAIAGRVITLNGVDRRIVGVMPPRFAYPSSNVEAWVPLRLDPNNFLEFWGEGWVPLVGRIRPGSNILQAQSEVRSLVSQFKRTFPYPMAHDWNSDSTAIPLQQDTVGDIRAKLLILLSSAGVMLLIACTNVASLLLSRASTRRKEMALRVALGAGRVRIVRQLLTESALLALLGGGLGLLLGMSAIAVFKAVVPSTTPGLALASIDWKVGGTIALLALLSGLAFGIAPALSASQIDLAGSIRTGSQRSTSTIWTRLRSWLIGAEIALTVVLVVSAGLLMRSLYTLSEAHLGFEPARVLTVRVSPNQSACVQRAACIALYDRVLNAARRVAGVETVAVANTLPLDGALPSMAVDVEGHPKSADYPAPVLWSGAISPDYIRLMGIPLLAGRNFTDADNERTGGVLLITKSTAERFWPGESPIGKHIKEAGESHWRTVVGVVGDVRQYSLGKNLPDGIPGAIYMPYAQSVHNDGQIYAAMTLIVRARPDSGRTAAELRRLAEKQEPNVPVGRVEPLQDLAAASIADFRSTIRVFLCFAGAALLLAGIGIYGLVSYWVTQRTFEIGVRSALGAARHRVVSLVLRQGLRVALVGIVAGLISALAVTRFLASLLYGVTATDALSFVAVTALVLGVTVAATAFPAWRAARIDPGKSLRID